MLTHHAANRHMMPLSNGVAPYPYEGRPDGMAADGQYRSALTVLQEVPNMGPTMTAPKTQVNPTHEQGFGRAPGWQWGWMRKNIPYSRSVINHNVARLGQLRVEGFLASGVHAPGRGAWQSGAGTNTPQRGVLPNPTTVYLTAAVPSAAIHGHAGGFSEPL